MFTPAPTSPTSVASGLASAPAASSVTAPVRVALMACASSRQTGTLVSGSNSTRTPVPRGRSRSTLENIEPNSFTP